MTQRKSHVYVNPDYVGVATRVRRPEANACWHILDKHYDELPEAARVAFDAVRAEEVKDGVSLRAWARKFKYAFDHGHPLPDRRFGVTVRVDTSAQKGREDLTSMGRAYLAVLLAGPRGVTSLEARLNGEKGGGPSGALSKLHKAGVVACLEAKR